MGQIIALFEKPSAEQQHEEELRRNQRAAQREVDKHRGHHAPQEDAGGGVGSSGVCRATVCKDYDAIGNDTDEEEMYMSLHRGYMIRHTGWCCTRPQKRWC